MVGGPAPSRMKHEDENTWWCRIHLCPNSVLHERAGIWSWAQQCGHIYSGSIWNNPTIYDVIDGLEWHWGYNQLQILVLAFDHSLPHIQWCSVVCSCKTIQEQKERRCAAK